MFSLPALGKPAPPTHRRLRPKTVDSSSTQGTPVLPSVVNAPASARRPSAASTEQSSPAAASSTAHSARSLLPQLRAAQARLESDERRQDEARAHDACFGEYYTKRVGLMDLERTRWRRLCREAAASRDIAFIHSVTALEVMEHRERLAAEDFEADAFVSIVRSAVEAQQDLQSRPVLPRQTRRSSRRGSMAMTQEKRDAVVALQVLLRRPMQFTRALRNTLLPSEVKERNAIIREEFEALDAAARRFERDWVEALETSARRLTGHDATRSLALLQCEASMNQCVQAERDERKLMTKLEAQSRVLIAEISARELIERIYDISRAVLGRTVISFAPFPHRLDAVITIQRYARALQQYSSLKAARLIPLPPPRYSRVTAAKLRSQAERLANQDDTVAQRLALPSSAFVTAEERARCQIDALQSRGFDRLQHLFWLDMSHRTAPVVASEEKARARLAKQEALELIQCFICGEEDRARLFVADFEATRRAFMKDAFDNGRLYADAALELHGAIMAAQLGVVREGDASPSPDWLHSRRSTVSAASGEGLHVKVSSRGSPHFTQVAPSAESGDSHYIRHLLGAVSQLSAHSLRMQQSSQAAMSPTRWKDEMRSLSERERVVSAAMDVLKAKTPKPPASRLTRSRMSVTPSIIALGDTHTRTLPRRLSFEPSAASRTTVEDDPPLSSFFAPAAAVDPQAPTMSLTRPASSASRDLHAFEVAQFLVTNAGRIHLVKLELAEEASRGRLVHEAEQWWLRNEVPYQLLFNPRAAQEWFGFTEPSSEDERHEQETAVLAARESYLCEVAIIAEWERVAREHVLDDYNHASRRIAQAFASSKKLVLLRSSNLNTSAELGSRCDEIVTMESLARAEVEANESNSLAPLEAHWSGAKATVAHLHGNLVRANVERFSDPLQPLVALQRWWRQEVAASNGCFGKQRILGKAVSERAAVLASSLRRYELLERKQRRDDLRSQNIELMLPRSSARAHHLATANVKLMKAEESRRHTILVSESLAASSLLAALQASEAKRAAAMRALQWTGPASRTAVHRLQAWWRRALRVKLLMRQVCIFLLLRQVQRTYLARRTKMVLPFIEFAASVLRARFTASWFALPSMATRRSGIGCLLLASAQDETLKGSGCYGLQLLGAAQGPGSGGLSYVDNVTTIELWRGIARALVASIAMSEDEMRSVLVDDEMSSFARLTAMQEEEATALHDQGDVSPALDAARGRKTKSLPVGNRLPVPTAVELAQDAGRRALELARRDGLDVPALQALEALNRKALEHSFALSWATFCSDHGPSYQRLCLSIGEYLRRVAAGGEALLAQRAELEDALLGEAAAAPRVLADRAVFEEQRAELLVDCLARPAFRLRQLSGPAEVTHRAVVEATEAAERASLAQQFYRTENGTTEGN